MDWINTKHGQTTVKFIIPTKNGLCGDYKYILHELIGDYDNKELNETKDYFIPISDHGFSIEINNDILFDDESGTVMIDESIKLQPIPKDFWL